MDFSLKPHPLVAHWVPGFFFCLILTLGHYGWNIHSMLNSLACLGTGSTATTITLLIISVVAFVIGEFIDSIRDILEIARDKTAEWLVNGKQECTRLKNVSQKVMGWFPQMEWTFLIDGDKEKILQVDERYFTWYVFSANMAIGLLLAMVSLVFSILFNVEQTFGLHEHIQKGETHFWAWSILATLFLINAANAISLRKETTQIACKWMKDNSKCPIKSIEKRKFCPKYEVKE